MALTEKEREIYNEYLETLQNLTFNSKPLIDVLTEVADENKEYARVIVQCIEDQLEKVSIELKLPVLYLIDSIIKNESIRKYYMGLFSVKLPWTFAKVYREGKDEVRSRLSKLRFTWNGVIAPDVLTTLDNVIRKINPSWQTAHINPKFVPRASPTTSVAATTTADVKSNITPTEELQQTQQELLKLKLRKEELEKELKMLRPKLDVAKANVKLTNDKTNEKQKSIAKPPVERLSAKANECFSQVEKLRTGTYNPAEIQRVRSAAANIKNVIVNVLESVKKGPFPNNPSLAALAEDTTILQDLISKLEETEKVLSETEKANQIKRKVIIDKNHLPPKTTTPKTAAVSTLTAPAIIRPTYSPGVLISKNVSNNPYVYTKPTSNGAGLVPQNPPAFRIAPVSSQLINAAARRRDPRLRKIELEESKATINNTSATKEVKTVSSAVPNDVKNDKQNALLTDVSKGKEFVSENVFANQTKSSVLPVDRENEPKMEKNGPLKPSKQDNIDKKVPSPPRISEIVSKKSDFEKKNDLDVKAPFKSKDVSLSKSESKSNKIKIKVKNIAKSKTAKMTELFGEAQNKPQKQKEVMQPALREERMLRMHKMAEALAKAGDIEREQFIENLSKRSVKMAQRLTKLLMEKDRNLNKKQPVVSELMDITDDKSDFMIISSPKTLSNDEEPIPVPPPPLLSSLRQLDQPAVVVDDLTNEQDEISEPEDKENLLRKEVQKLEEEERLLEANIQKQTAVIKEKADISSMNLSEQLEAVMNAAVENTKQPETGISSARPTLSQDTDIRTLLPSTIGLNMGCPLPAVSEIISAPVTTATETSPLANPFGLALTTKDIDYRKLFGFPLPPIPANKETDDGNKKEDTSSPEQDNENLESTTKSENCVKRKQNEKPDHKSKRRRTVSGSIGSDSENSRDSPDNIREQHYDSNRYSDSDTEISGKDRMDIDTERWRDDLKLQPPPSLDDSRLSEILAPVSESRSAIKSPPKFHMFSQNFIHPFSNMNFGQIREVRDPNIELVKMINRDPIKVINIDRIPREIRHYGSTAVVFMNWDDPRQVSFFDQQRKHHRNELRGPNRDIPCRRWIVIDKDVEVPLFLNQPEVMVLVDRKPHGFRLGTPARELYVDGVGYECCFNGPSINVLMDGIYHSIRLNGDRPRVDISERKRQDLVAGKISLIINDSSTFNVFLDAKPQSIVVNGIPFVFMFIDALKRVLINDTPFDTNFGGVPQVFHYKGNPYKFQFSPLPPGIVPGAINIFQMVMTKLPSPPPLPPSLQYSALSSNTDDFPVIPVPPTMPSLSSNVPTMPVNTIRNLESQTTVPFENPSSEPKPLTNNILENLNIDELFQKLVASGIVPSSNSSIAIQEDIKPPEKEDMIMKFVDFAKPETLKQRQTGMVARLYYGEQCGSCGLRFPPESMEPTDQMKPRMSKYGEHLNWHYRRNTSKKNKDGARNIHSRRWYYNVGDWMIFQEVEDDNDKVPTCFDSETAEEEVKEEIPCVRAGENPHDAACELCRDKFELIYNHEEDEWQLRGAIRIADKLYHPACHQDFNEIADQSEVEEIVDLVEPIVVDDILAPEEGTINLDDSSVPEPDNTTIPIKNDEAPIIENSEKNKIATFENCSITIKKEKLDVVKESKDQSDNKESILSNDASLTVEGKSSVEDDEDSDVEEVQLIEQPIEEIVIPDDGNDLEPNLETLNAEDIIAVQQQEIDLIETTEEKDVEFQDKIVDITHVPNVASIDGNIELNDQCHVPSGATKIKINIAKSLEKAQSPKLDENEKDENVVANVAKECEPELITTPVDVKPKIKGRMLKKCCPIIEKRKENEMSAICSIM